MRGGKLCSGLEGYESAGGRLDGRIKTAKRSCGKRCWRRGGCGGMEWRQEDDGDDDPEAVAVTKCLRKELWSGRILRKERPS